MRPIVRGELPLKAWVMEEAERTGQSVAAIRGRLARNPAKHFPHVEIIRINCRVVFVRRKEGA